jgi:CRISPR-associated protein Cmr2
MIRDYLASKPQGTQFKRGIEVSAHYSFQMGVNNRNQAKNTRASWQQNNHNVNCLELLPATIAAYYEKFFKSPDIDLAVLPNYSFVLQFTFTLAQPYISRDEQDFYIIDNPARKDKIFGLPYVASTSWKGSLRAALWQLGHREQDERIRRLFGNAKDAEDQESFRAGRLYFYPTFFTHKSLEIINPQDRRLRSGKDPILFESVPKDTPGVFTLLYVPFDIIGENEQETRTEVAGDLQLVATGLQAMFRTYGFGAKTSSGFGLAREDASGTLTIRADYPLKSVDSFTRLVEAAQGLRSVLLG